MTPKSLKPGEQFHFLQSGFSYRADVRYLSSGQVSRRGQTVTVTDRLIEANQDRYGDSWLDSVDDADEQTRRWGRQMFARGEAPADFDRFVPGTAEAEEERARQRTEAWAIPERSEREAALAEIEGRFGMKTTSSFISARGYAGLS